MKKGVFGALGIMVILRIIVIRISNVLVRFLFLFFCDIINVGDGR